jgi:hypothetical protein
MAKNALRSSIWKDVKNSRIAYIQKLNTNLHEGDSLPTPGFNFRQTVTSPALIFVSERFAFLSSIFSFAKKQLGQPTK